MLPDTIRNVKIGMAVFVVLFFGGIQAYFYFSRQAMVESMREGRGRPGGGPIRPAGDSKRLSQMSQLANRDPEAALKIADEIIAKPESDNEKRTALSRRPQLLEWAIQRHLDGGRRAEARVLRERMEKQYPASSEAERVRGNWRRFVGNEAVKALRGPDRAAEAAAFRELWALRPRENESSAFDGLSLELQNRWRSAVTAKSPDASERLLAAAAVFTRWEQVQSLVGNIRNLPGDPVEFAAQADAHGRTDQRHVALVFWQVAVDKLRSGYDDWPGAKALDRTRREALALEFRRKCAAGWMELGDRLRKGERPEYVLMSPRQAYQGAVRIGQGLVEEMEALTHQLEFEAAEIARHAEPVTKIPLTRLIDLSKLDFQEVAVIESTGHEVRSKIREALERGGHRLWECCLETPGFDPWLTVPLAVRESIDAKPEAGPERPPTRGAAPAVAPTAQAAEAARRKKLADYYRTDYLHIPLGEAEPLRAVLHQTYARWGQTYQKGQGEEAFSMLREVLRESTDQTLRDDVVKTLRARLVRLRESGDFDGFFVLAGFYASEVGLPARGEPFRDEFRKGLESAATGFKMGGGMKRIFIQSLLAKCFPDEAVGREALREASTAAFQAVATTAPDKPNTIIMPSTVPGHAVHLINNGTEHHLLAFYRGSSLVMAHYWPWRRGTVVIPEGTYEVVVLSPASSIRPYREQSSQASGVRMSEYVIKTSGGGAGSPWAQASRSLAGGDYKLLYAPPNLGELKVEPRTGIPLRAK